MQVWYKYELYDGRFLVHVGITTDPIRCRYEHGKTKKFTRLRIIGRTKYRERALEWRDKRLQSYRKYHKKESPRYNHPLLGDFTEY